MLSGVEFPATSIYVASAALGRSRAQSASTTAAWRHRDIPRIGIIKKKAETEGRIRPAQAERCIMNPMSLSLIAFACVFGGTFLAMFLRSRLPGHHLKGDTKDVVRLGTGLIGTIAALVLGLLIASANSTYETQSGQVRQLTANIVLLDRTLAQYGPETDSARNLLWHAIAALADRIWRENGSDSGNAEAFEASAAALSFYDEILKLSPRNESQRFLQARAVDTSTDLAKTRLLLFAGTGGSIPMPFLVILISWLTIIFASFSLFADNNATTIAALGLFALSAAASIFLILELSQPFTDLMMISSEPLRNALGPLTS
jgi:hypothetical protein